MSTEIDLYNLLTELDAEGRPVDLRAGNLLARMGQRHLAEYRALCAKGEAKLPVWQRAIIERIETAAQTPLTVLDCQCIAEQLRDLWLSNDYGAFDRQYWLGVVESLLTTAKLRAKQSPKVKRFVTRDDVAKRCGFRSVDAMEQFLKRERAARKKLRR